MDHTCEASRLRVGQNKMEEAQTRGAARNPRADDRRATKYSTRSRPVRAAHCLAALVALTITLGQYIQPARADAALSEVWSETDGLQVKYSTNHDNVLSSKGSELSLSSNQQAQRNAEPSSSENGEGQAQSGSSASQEASQSSGGEESSSPSSDDSSSSSESNSSQGEGEQSDEQSGGGSNEQGAADSRQNEKSILPSSSGRVPHGPSPAKHSSATYGLKSHQSSFREEPNPSTRPFKSSSKSVDSAATFESLGPSFTDNNEAPTANDEQTSADSDSSDSQQFKEGPQMSSSLSKFRQPGRLFKEAVRMTDSGGKHDRANADEGDDSSSSARETSEKSDKYSSKSPASASNNDDDDDESDSNSDGSWDAPASNRQSVDKRPSQEQNMIDYERPDKATTKESLSGDEVANQDNSDQLFRSAPMQTAGATRPHGQFGLEQDEDLENNGGYREQPAIAQGPMYYDNSGRALLAASSQKGQTQAYSGKLVATSARPNTNQADLSKLAHKQLAYFRGVKVDAGSIRQPLMRLNAAANQERAPDGSPDSVRDNFISPGHYPGSMPHLTQAASEIAQSATDTQIPSAPATAPILASVATVDNQKSSVEAAGGEQGAKLSSQETTSELRGSKPDSDINRQNSIPSDTKTSDGEEQRQSESKGILSIAVTPMPELQLESQQIMAPILVSTTTMAPMTSTTVRPAEEDKPNATTTTSTSTTSTTTTTKAPALKRFKFRKYR